MSYVSLGPAEAHVTEMLSRLPDDPAQVNGNLVRGLLKTIQGEAQTRSSRTQGGRPTSDDPSQPMAADGTEATANESQHAVFAFALRDARHC